MQEYSVNSQRSTPCPSDVCQCGHRELLESDPTGTRYPAVFLTKMTEQKILKRIENINTVQDFDGLRNEIRKRFRIIFSVQGDGSVTIPEVPGFCRRAQKNLRNAFESRFRSESPFLRSVLDRPDIDENE